MHILWIIIIGGLAGWIAGKIMRGDGFGIIIDVLVGIIGGWIGGSVLGWFGVYGGGIISDLIIAVIGAIILIWIIRMVRKVA